MNSYQQRKLQLWRAERFAQRHPVGVHIAIFVIVVASVFAAFYMAVRLESAL